MKKHFTIIGGGIAGLTTAIALANAGIDATVYEAAPVITEAGAGLGLGANAIRAFRVLGIDEAVIAAGRFLPSFTVYDQHGKVITKTDSVSLSKKYGLDNFTIHRAVLQQILLAKIAPAKVITNKRVGSIAQKGDKVLIEFTDGTNHETDFLIAADGIHSAIRRQLLPQAEIRYSGYSCWRAVIENDDTGATACSETWADKGRFGIVPLQENKLYWFACINTPAANSDLQHYTTDDLYKNFRNYHQPVPGIIKRTGNKDLIWGDIFDLKPISKYAFGNILLIGDAAHATTPNLGQGACQAIEDAVILAAEISVNADIATAFRNFEERRLQRTRWISESSRRIGKLAQLENKLLIGIRNFLLTALPASFNDKQFERLYTTDF